MSSKEQLRKLVRDNLDVIAEHVNAALRGKGIVDMKHVLGRVGRGGQLPYWYKTLKEKGNLPNLDGKTIGSVVEMLLVGTLEALLLPPLALIATEVEDIEGPVRLSVNMEISLKLDEALSTGVNGKPA